MFILGNRPHAGSVTNTRCPFRPWLESISESIEWSGRGLLRPFNAALSYYAQVHVKWHLAVINIAIQTRSYRAKFVPIAAAKSWRAVTWTFPTWKSAKLRTAIRNTSVEKELAKCLHDLKQRKRIHGPVPTVDDLVNPEAERGITNLSVPDQIVDDEIVAMVRKRQTKDDLLSITTQCQDNR